jgi:hypothetical protein
MPEDHAKGKAQVVPESVHGAEEVSLGLGLCRTRVRRRGLCDRETRRSWKRTTACFAPGCTLRVAA